MKLTHAQCKSLAGDPLILAASEEQEIRKEWEKRDRVYKAAMRWYRLHIVEHSTYESYKKDIPKLAKARTVLYEACREAKK